jgi:hypothetical protein
MCYHQNRAYKVRAIHRLQQQQQSQRDSLSLSLSQISITSIAADCTQISITSRNTKNKSEYGRNQICRLVRIPPANPTSKIGIEFTIKSSCLRLSSLGESSRAAEAQQQAELCSNSSKQQ